MGLRHKGEPRYAALDLGTNNCRLLVAEPRTRGFVVVDSFSRITRLGEGLAANDRLSEAAMSRTLAALKLVGALASLGLITLMLWRMLPEALDTYEFGGVTLDLKMRYFWYWIPILAGCAVSILAAAAALAPLARTPKKEVQRNGS